MEPIYGILESLGGATPLISPSWNAGGPPRLLCLPGPGSGSYSGRDGACLGAG